MIIIISYDRTHNFKILLSYQLWKNWKVSTYWTITTGALYTDVIGKYLGGEDYRDSPYGFVSSGDPVTDANFLFRPLEDIKNGKRLPWQHRLDIGINGSLSLGQIYVKTLYCKYLIFIIHIILIIIRLMSAMPGKVRNFIGAHLSFLHLE